MIVRVAAPMRPRGIPRILPAAVARKTCGALAATAAFTVSPSIEIRFGLHDGQGRIVGFLRAENLRAWDFKVYDLHQRVVATLVKTWEGWARTAREGAR